METKFMVYEEGHPITTIIDGKIRILTFPDKDSVEAYCLGRKQNNPLAFLYLPAVYEPRKEPNQTNT